MESNNFAWTKFYSEFADKLLQYKSNRVELLGIIKGVFDKLGMRYPFMDNGIPIDDICPFTVLGCFNKGITDDNRIALMRSFVENLGVTTEVPTKFDGIPVLNPMRAWFFGYKANRKPDDISNLWNVFEAAIGYADSPSDMTKTTFSSSYDKVRKQLCIKWNITMGLYWIRPFAYLNLDERNRGYLLNRENAYAAEIASISNLKQPPTAKTYLELIAACKARFNQADSIFHSFPELSQGAWLTSTADSKKKVSTASFLKWFAPLVNALRELGGTGAPEQVRNQIISDLNLSDEVINETRGKTGAKKFDNEVAFARNYLTYEDYIDKSVRGLWKLTEKGMTAPINEEIASEIFMKWIDILKDRRENADASASGERSKNEVRYWIYAPGEGSRMWDEFYADGLMGIGWDEMGDLKLYPTKDAMKVKMKELYGDEYSYMNSALATWQFANEIQTGDIVYAKKGMYKVIGRGVVESEYIYDNSRNEYKHIHKIKWTHNGEWEHPGQAVVKTLTDITSYIDYVQKLEALFLNDSTETVLPEQKEIPYPDYIDAYFLGEVFMDADRYETLINLLKVKKNIILQGAPGVGKTFAAKRLAYSIMGKRDTSRVMMVQFHQSYSYEDFIIGYRPTKDGFELSAGPFYQFCKKAQDDNERDYFFIIDEINRGNLSKIFGELLMLIEKDKRGEKLRLLYSNELFSVPKNVYIIGMMNTADRSLAMIDYALRRRFAFFEIEPAFDSVGFRAIMEENAHPKFSALVEQIKSLNDFICKDEALGDGFRIGHSYLCTSEEITDKWLADVVKYGLLPFLMNIGLMRRQKLSSGRKNCVVR